MKYMYEVCIYEVCMHEVYVMYTSIGTPFITTELIIYACIFIYIYACM